MEMYSIVGAHSSQSVRSHCSVTCGQGSGASGPERPYIRHRDVAKALVKFTMLVCGTVHCTVSSRARSRAAPKLVSLASFPTVLIPDSSLTHIEPCGYFIGIRIPCWRGSCHRGYRPTSCAKTDDFRNFLRSRNSNGNVIDLGSAQLSVCPVTLRTYCSFIVTLSGDVWAGLRAGPER